MRLKVRLAQKEDIYRDIIRIPEQYRLDNEGKLIPEGTICLVLVNSRKVYAILRGNLNVDNAEAQIDERLRNRLNLSVDKEEEITFKKSGLWGEFMWAWQASDPAYRISARLGFLSVLLGILALLITIFSIAHF